MPYLFILTIVNSITSARGFQNNFRIDLGGVPIGVLEGTLGLGIVVALLMGGRIKSRGLVDRPHPAYVMCMTLLMAGFVCGVVGAFTHDAIPKYKMVFMREYFGMPAAVFVGYQLTGTLRSAKKFPYALVLAGIGVSIMVMAAFERGAERYELKGDWGALRTVNFVTNYAGVASGILLYSVLAGLRLMPMPLALMLSGFCFVGQLTPLHRSDWAAQAAAMAAIPFCMPKGARIKQAVRLVIASMALLASLYVGLHVASLVTGKDFHKTFDDRLRSMLPGQKVKSSDSKAWDTRFPAIYKELEIWLTNPIMGRGFAIEESLGLEGAAAVGFGFHHNAYTSTMAETGLIGLGGIILAVWSPIILGYKMVRDRFDRTSVLIGALGIIAGMQQAVLGMATASFNGYRMAMLIGVISGVVFRVRDLQRTAMAVSQANGWPYGIDVEPVIEQFGDPQALAGYYDELPPIPDFDDQGRPLPGAYAHVHGGYLSSN